MTDHPTRAEVNARVDARLVARGIEVAWCPCALCEAKGFKTLEDVIEHNMTGPQFYNREQAESLAHAHKRRQAGEPPRLCVCGCGPV